MNQSVKWISVGLIYEHLIPSWSKDFRFHIDMQISSVIY